MNTPISWIKAYVPDLDCSVQEYVDRMTLSGSHVENAVYLDKNLENIVVGRVESIEKHPDADKLIVCQVDVGEKKVQIVTGAPNVTESALIPVVLDGGRVAGGHDGSPNPENGIKIKKGKLRGVVSEGMMCSIEELGSSREMYPEAPENGIYVFEDDADVKPGDDAVAALGLRDAVVEFEITSNRVDCFSMIGMAREAAATFDKPFHAPEVKVTGNDDDVNNYISVEVHDPDLCPRYTARVVKNIRLAPSPKWMQRRLAAMGIRPINNIVDITNYVMEEYGQPMHAYDLDTIRGKKIIVKRAEDGDVYTTLDGQERALDHDVIMINDAEGPVGIGGIMGGENSMVTDQIKTLLFEAANFDGTNIRLSSKRIGLRTDASGKFEKGLDPESALAAMNRACQLVEEMDAGDVVGGVIDVYPNPVSQVTLSFEPDKYNRLLGTDITADQMLEYLKRLEIGYDEESNLLQIPSFRLDLRCQADIAEEVARFFGYDNIPTTLPHGEATAGKESFSARVQKVLQETAEQNGFCGGMCYSFESPRVFDKLRLDADDPLRRAIVISNPLGEDYSIMRTIELDGLLTSLAGNFNHRNKEVRLYEIGNVYLPKSLPLTELPEERKRMALGMYGRVDFFDLKGVLEEMFLKLGLGDRVEFVPSSDRNYLHPGRQAIIEINGEYAGFIGQIHPLVCLNYGMKCEVYAAGLDIPVIVDKASFDRKYKGVAKYPAVNRDLALVMDKEVFVGDVEKIMKAKGGKLLESIELFDVYEGAQVGKGKKSVAFSLVFRSSEGSLEAAEVNKIVDRILKELETSGIELRA
ncbi:MAG: phenylalanine--tRNA ligase subunit beta [Eubacterium sp.]|nr:phenylalanine--tRNA ligase subunit beta [Eubacterium sp.]